jgi:hypothetical protein
MIKPACTGLSVMLEVCALLIMLDACASGRPLSEIVPTPAGARLQGLVQSELDRRLPAPQAATRKTLTAAAQAAPQHVQALVLEGLNAPWSGLDRLERHGLRFAGLARSDSVALSDLIGALASAGDIPVAPVTIPPTPPDRSMPVQIAYLTSVLQQAGEFRERALQKLTRADREFLFTQAATLVEQFTPQVESNEQTGPQIEAMQRFCDLVTQIDQTAMLAAAQTLAHLADDEWLKLMEEIPADRPVQPPPAGVTGEVLFVGETSVGLMVIGGRGPNSYRLDHRFALVLDLGGDDLYEGAIAAPASIDRGMSMVIDAAGNDTYRPAPLGLATGRVGVGLLIDRFGNDIYHLAPGSGATGVAGIGLLDDREGHDRYVGSIFTQGAAMGGLGLLVDRLGEDTFTNAGYGLGFGAPLGLGALLDLEGDDHYECGGQIASSYNPLEHPEVKPGDPGFQYDCFGLGAGSGFRVVRRTGETLAFEGLAGGIGFLMDLEGEDRYRSANFSQGAGYFFGAGLKMDLGGHDQHLTARYGLGAAAHGGLGLHLDYAGDDRYGSTGPYYDCGAAWDRSVALCLDAGTGDDRYDLSKSDGLGLADLGAWGLFVDEGGEDRYLVPRGMGMAAHNSLGMFFDLAGKDDYASVPPSESDRRENGQTVVDQAGGLFQDR